MDITDTLPSQLGFIVLMLFGSFAADSCDNALASEAEQ